MQDPPRHFSRSAPAPSWAASPPARATRIAALCAAGLVLGSMAGCKLVDQRTFDASAGRPPVPHLPPARPGPPPPPPLATVRFGAPLEEWQPGLADIVRLALDRKPTALFRVRVLVPQTGAPADQSASLVRAIAQGGSPVAETIRGAGASTAQIEMSGMTDPSVAQPEIRVYVR